MSHPALPHDTAEQLAQRIEQLEIKLSYAEDLLDTLNTLVTRQQDQIDRLLREVGHLRRQREDDTPPPSAACGMNCRRITEPERVWERWGGQLPPQRAKTRLNRGRSPRVAR